MVRACLEPFVPPQETYMTDSMNPSSDDFASMFESSAAASAMQEGQVVPATVIRIENDAVLVDIGLKTEGRIPLATVQRSLLAVYALLWDECTFQKPHSRLHGFRPALLLAVFRALSG